MHGPRPIGEAEEPEDISVLLYLDEVESVREPALPLVRDRLQLQARAGIIEVSVPGAVGRDGGAELPLFAHVGFEGDRPTRFRAKIGDTVVGPGSAAAGTRSRTRSAPCARG